MKGPHKAVKDGDLGQTEARFKLALAYQKTFDGTAEPNQAMMVLIDLADHCNYYRPTALDAPDALLRVHNSMRAVFQHIRDFLILSHEEWDALERAARAEREGS